MAAVSAQRTSKGNPAHKRMSNDKLKARRAACWARGEKRKEARRQAQDAAHRRNLDAGVTPWQVVRLARKRRRAA